MSDSPETDELSERAQRNWQVSGLEIWELARSLERRLQAALFEAKALQLALQAVVDSCREQK